MPRPTVLTIAFALALGATAAVAAPTVQPSSGGSTPTTDTLCPTPDAAKCKSEGYLDSLCGQRHLDICKPIALEAMEKYYKKVDRPTVKMLRPKLSEMPQHVETGKYFKYTHPTQAQAGHTQYRSQYRKVGDPLQGLQGMDMSQHPPVTRTDTVDPNVAKEFHRKPEWLEPTIAQVRDCDEYAYERSYGITRFIDRASACKGDFECVFDLAYMPGAVGISNRVLRTTDGNPLPKTFDLFTGTRPKNEMFVHGGAFVRTDGLKAFPGSKVVTALETAMESGKAFYKIGSCGSGGCSEPRKFANEWDWHEFLHEKVENVSQAENEEYMRRLAQFRNLMEQWNAAVAWENSLLQGLPEDEQVLVLPLDMRATNPFDRHEIEQEYIERGRDTLKALKAKFGASVVNKSMPQIRQLAKAAQQHGAKGSVSPLAGFAAPSPQAGTSTPQHTAVGDHGGATFQGTDIGGEISKCLKDPDEFGLESAYKGPISCRIGEFLRAEWKRMQEGHKSCLDLGNFACDWTPQMFQASVLDQLPTLDQQLSDRAYCKAWDNAQTFSSPYVPPVAEVKRRLDKYREEMGAAQHLIEPYDKGPSPRGRKLGKDWGGGDYLGNKKLFAVGYDYDVGWEALPQERTAEGTGGFVCELAGSAHVDTGFDAWIMNNKVSVVDGQVAARANFDGDGDMRFKAHLEMFDQTVFTTGRNGKGKLKWKVAQSFGDETQVGWMIQVPSFKPRFDVYVGVPISGEMWGELMFGSALELEGAASTDCDENNPKFGVVAGYGPMFGAWGLGQVGVGISGIASAGVRAALNLVLIHMPASFDMRLVLKDDPQTEAKEASPNVRFASELALTLATLAGRVSLYVEFFTYDEEFELFRWKGFGPTRAQLMPLMSGDVPMAGFDRQTNP